VSEVANLEPAATSCTKAERQELDRSTTKEDTETEPGEE